MQFSVEAGPGEEYILWIVLALFIVVPVLLGILIGRSAAKRGMNPWGWGILVTLICIVGVPVFLIMKKPVVGKTRKDQPPEGTKKCPYCAETIKSEAILCRFCGKELIQMPPRDFQQEVSIQGEKPDGLAATRNGDDGTMRYMHTQVPKKKTTVTRKFMYGGLAAVALIVLIAFILGYSSGPSKEVVRKLAPINRDIDAVKNGIRAYHMEHDKVARASDAKTINAIYGIDPSTEFAAYKVSREGVITVTLVNVSDDWNGKTVTSTPNSDFSEWEWGGTLDQEYIRLFK
jgi:hypothetical protein